MDKQQIIRILKVSIIATAIILAFEIIFDIPAINNFFAGLVKNNEYAYLFIWLIMYLQCTILNIPAYVILSASLSIGIEILSVKYILVVLSAYMLGCITAYWLGRWFGSKAVKWCAGSDDEFTKWSNTINSKGKIWYFLTVIFPLFPDDILCLVAGSVKMNFTFFTIANLIGRGVGLVCMILFLKFIGTLGRGFPFMIIVWFICLIAEVIALLVLKHSQK